MTELSTQNSVPGGVKRARTKEAASVMIRDRLCYLTVVVTICWTQSLASAADVMESHPDPSVPSERTTPSDEQPGDSVDVAVVTAAGWLASIAAREPDVAACVEAALSHFSGQEESLGELLRRSRRANWLPNSLRLAGVYRHVREDEWRYHVDQSFDESDLIDATDVEDRLLDQRNSYVEVRMQLEWRLSELRHSSDEVSLRRLDRSRSEDSRELAEIVIELFYDRRREQMKYYESWQKDSPYETAEIALVIDQQTALLSELTGGWFTRHLPPGDASLTPHWRLTSSRHD